METSTVQRTETETGAPSCVHGERDAAACVLCVVERTTDGATTRTAARDAAQLRAAIRRAQRRRDVARGYTLFPTYAVTQRLTDAAQRTAERYAGVDAAEVAADTLETIARMVGRPTATDAYIASVMTTPHGVRLARRIARNAARDAAQGTGTMPRLRVDTDAVVASVERAYAARGETSPLAVRVGVVNGHAVSAVRRMTTAERTQWIRETMRYQRVERSPLFSPWLDGFGDTPPDTDNGRPADSAPFDTAPRRTVPPLAVRLQRNGTDTETAAAAWFLLEYVSTRRANDTYPRRIPWTPLAAALSVSPSTLLRRVRGALDALQRAERARGVSYGDAPYNAPHGVDAVRTGRRPRTWNTDGRAVLSPLAPYAWTPVTTTDTNGRAVVTLALRPRYAVTDGAPVRRDTFDTDALRRGFTALSAAWLTDTDGDGDGVPHALPNGRTYGVRGDTPDTDTAAAYRTPAAAAWLREHGDTDTPADTATA